jgi:hypothetical protein
VEYEGTPEPSHEIKDLYWAGIFEILTNEKKYASGLRSMVPDLIAKGKLTISGEIRKYIEQAENFYLLQSDPATAALTLPDAEKLLDLITGVNRPDI